jgi:hypothetical protein
MATELQFIKSASGTSVSSLSVTDCFSANYDVYMISISKIDKSAIGQTRLRFIDSGGSVISDAEYDYAELVLTSYAAFAEGKATNATFLDGLGYSSTALADGIGSTSYVYNPYDSSSYTFTTSQSSGLYNVGGGGLVGYKQIGVHKVAEQITGINVLPNSGTYDNITVNVYGVK